MMEGSLEDRRSGVHLRAGAKERRGSRLENRRGGVQWEKEKVIVRRRSVTGLEGLCNVHVVEWMEREGKRGELDG